MGKALTVYDINYQALHANFYRKQKKSKSKVAADPAPTQKKIPKLKNSVMAPPPHFKPHKEPEYKMKLTAKGTFIHAYKVEEKFRNVFGRILIIMLENILNKRVTLKRNNKFWI